MRDHRRPGWDTRTAVVIASGPSLTADDCRRVMMCRANDSVRVISVSNAWKLCAKWADVFFAADRRYWSAYFKAMCAAGIEREEMYTSCVAASALHKINRVKAANQPGLGLTSLNTGGNSGYMGINLAYLFGARKIILLGFDMQAGPDGAKHFDGSHPPGLSQCMPFPEWLHRFKALAKDLKERDIEVLNCARSTALWDFQRPSLEDALPPLT